MFCLTTLGTVESEFFDMTDLREYFRDSLGHFEYTLRFIGRQQANLSEVHQHYLLTLQGKVNKRLRLLTVISTVFLPLTLIARIYGMNFQYMPELTWRYSYPVVIAAMLALAAVLLWAFHQKGWFK
ncbi:MAG: magnesium transporter CorA family protein [Deltaproteobacteria bacterium]|nr:magnesium transporter CorA family protein [Deltaproteobacteria bacterium]MBW2340983.1 magnesium transporter CorA family protein [Deltaproteobacteria bacterium]